MANVRHFGATGDGKADDTDAILHALDQGDGLLYFPRGDYRITRSIQIALDRDGRTAIEGERGTAKIIMTGEGPAFHIVGTHEGTADPRDFKPNVWDRQRMPSVLNIEIEGGAPGADGFLIEGTMQATFEGVLIRRVRHGIHITTRNRNVVISHCHIYHNIGVGVLIDECNLHQINIIGNHISYNRLGGIRIESSEVRNLQITGNDIEYNNHRAHGTDPVPTAEIYIDTTADGASVNEITVASNTIQATTSPGGANIRMIDNITDEGSYLTSKGRRPGLWTITGNIIGSQENNVHLTGCYGIILSGNFIYSCANRNLLVEHCGQINIGSCSFRQHSPEGMTGVRIVDSSDIIFSGCQIRDETEKGQVTGASLIELINCQRVTMNGCQITDGVPFGIDMENPTQISVVGCSLVDTRAKRAMHTALRARGKGQANLVAHNTLGLGIDKNPWVMEADIASKIDGNIVVE